MKVRLKADTTYEKSSCEVRAEPVSSSLKRFDANLRFEEARAATRWTFAGFGELVRIEREATRSAPRGNDLDGIAGRLGRAQRVTQIIFGIAPREAELARQRRHRTWRTRHAFEQFSSERHAVIPRSPRASPLRQSSIRPAGETGFEAGQIVQRPG